MGGAHRGPVGTEQELLLLRHAKSSHAGAGDDFDRPLARRGREAAPRLGAWMAAQGIRPDRVVASPARRARETADLVLAALGPDGPEVRLDDRVYEASLSDLVEVLRDQPRTAHRVLLVGHNPGLDDLLLWLSRDDPLRTDDGKLITTCALARLRVPVGWPDLAPGAGGLVLLVRPRDLETT